MSGHSRWAQIKHKKSADDAKRSQLFAKLAREIEATAKSSGADPHANPRLASLIEEARKAQFPKENVERAIERARSGLGHEPMWFEAYGPAGVALLIEVSPGSSREAALANIHKTLSRGGGKLAQPGEVRWRFDENLRPRYPIELGEGTKAALAHCLEDLAVLDGLLTIRHNAAL